MYVVGVMVVIKEGKKKENDWDHDADTDYCLQEINMLDLSAVERQMALNEV